MKVQVCVFVWFLGPGIALCNFFGERSESYCGLSNVLITDIPENCSSVFFFAVYMDLNYNATDSNYSSNFSNIILLIFCINKYIYI